MQLKKAPRQKNGPQRIRAIGDLRCGLDTIERLPRSLNGPVMGMQDGLKQELTAVQSSAVLIDWLHRPVTSNRAGLVHGPAEERLGVLKIATEKGQSCQKQPWFRLPEKRGVLRQRQPFQQVLNESICSGDVVLLQTTIRLNQCGLGGRHVLPRR